MKTETAYYQSPIGWLEIIANDEALVRINYHKPVSEEAEKTSEHPLIRQTIRELEEYFAGMRQEFTIPLSFEGTPFQHKAWTALLDIPYGQTSNYLQIAKLSGNIKASRATGTAIGRNPIPIIIPCHRVIASDGKMGGFAWGIEVKKQLLDLEKKQNK